MDLGPEAQVRILKGPTYSDAFNQCLQYINYVEECWLQASQLFLAEKFPFSSFFSILTLEETAKLSLLRYELPQFQDKNPKSFKPTKEKDWFFKHKDKHVLAILEGAIVNSRLDRLLGSDKIGEFIQKAKKGKVEEIRQSCLYISSDQNKTTTPNQNISSRDSKFLAILSGEIMAEVLGITPEIWERLLEKVSEFESKL